MDDLFNRKNKGKPLDEYDVQEIKHLVVKVYGYHFWCTCNLDELLDALPLLYEDKHKAENLRLCALKSYGVNNPK